MTGDLIPANVLATHTIANVSETLAEKLGLPRQYRSIGIITADSDDVTYCALDEATKAAAVEVVYGRSLYAGAGNASTKLAGEVIGILAGPNPAEVQSGLRACAEFMASGVGFRSANEDGSIVYFAHTVSRTGTYLSKTAGVREGEALAYLIAPPLEAVVGLDEALKASDVELAALFEPPSETNFGGGLLTGTQSACNAACAAFAEAVKAVAARRGRSDRAAETRRAGGRRPPRRCRGELCPPAARQDEVNHLDKDLQSIQETRELLRQAKQAQRALAGMSQEQLDKITAAIAAAAGEHARRLADMAVEETGFGKKEDKELKNRFAATTLYEAIRDEKTHGILAENREKRTIDIGVPVGIVAGLVPSTNPTSTVIYKSMICMKAGNPIIFSPHPSAVNCILETVNVVRRAAEGAGAPAGSISCITTPTLEATNALMRHDDTRLILATGGGAMVKAAYSSGTPAIGVGAGNGPAYIHHTADVRLAVKRILDSKTFDNGTICASEQSIVVERRMEGAVTAELKAQGAYLLDDEEHRLLSKFILRPNGTMNPAIVGKSVETVAKLAGLTRVPPTARVLVARETGVGPGYPYSNEKLGLILAYYVEDSEEAVLRRCVEILEWEGAGHTFAIHTEDADAAKRFAAAVPASRVLVNTPAALGGIGATTCLFPALTLGCGAVGGSSSSNNIGPLDLINIKRVAWGVKELEELRGNRPAAGYAPCAVDESLLNELVNRIIGRLSV